MSFLIGFAPLLEMSVGKVVGIEFTGIPEYYVYFLAAAAGVIVFGIALANPFWGILIFMLLLPFRSEEYALANIGGAVVRLADPVALFTFIGLLNRDIFTRRTGLPLERAGIELPLLVLAWWVFLSFTWCESYRSAVSKLLQFSYAIVLFYMVLALIRTRKQLITAMYSWLLGGLLIGGIALAQAIAGIGGGKGRAVSFQTSAIESGEYLNYSILMAIGLFMIAKSKLGKAFVLSSIALMLLGTILGSAARGPLLGLAFGLLFLYLFRDRFRSYVHWLIPFGVVGSVAAFFVFGLFGQNLLTLVAIAFRRFIELIENPVMDPGWAYRLNIWSALWRLFTEHPLLGIGVGSLSQLLPDYTMEYFRDPELAHNMYLEVFITLGPFGFLLFLWFMWRMLRILAGYLLDKSDYVLYLLYGTLLAAQVAKAVGNLSFGMFFEDRVEWVAIALCFAAAKIYKDSHEARARGAAPEEAGA
jgi:O-antigen ligase